MLRTIFSIGLFAVLGLFALKFIFGIFGIALGLFLWLFFAAIKIAIVGLVIYFAYGARHSRVASASDQGV